MLKGRLLDNETINAKIITQSVLSVAHSPKIVDRTWWVYDDELKDYVDTGVIAEGQDGYTPQKNIDYKDGEDGVSVTHSWNGTVLTVNSASGTSSADLKGDKGDKGADGKDGANGRDGINGKNGINGTNGKDGISPTHYWSGTKLTITSASGTSTADLKGAKGDQGIQGIEGKKGLDGKDGKDGEKGENGADGRDGKDGYTPIKGIDYFDGKDGLNGKDGKDGYTPRKGIDYFDGEKGEKGDQGLQGLRGEKGDKGDRGEKGERGEKGADGLNGQDGAKGDKGDRGEQGLKGDKGDKGDQGIQGVKGEKGDKGDRGSDAPSKVFTISYEHFTVELNATKGVAPYSTSYGSADITIDEEWAELVGFDWVEGALYNFIINETIGSSTYRNGRIRIGEDGDWKPIFGYNSAYEAVYSCLIKAQTYLYQYKSNVIADGCLCREYDANTTYAYLVNTIVGDATDSPIHIDDNGYGARYSLAFPTTPLSDANGIVTDEMWSSLIASSSTGTTKKINTVPKFYIDRHPIYIYSANVTKGAKAVNSVYQDYYGMDLRYSVNTNATYMTRTKKCFLWLKNFDENDLSFEADATIGNIMTLDKIPTRFPSSVSGDVYLYFLGWTTTNWYGLSPCFTQANRLFKYTPSTGEFHDTNILVG